MEQRVFFLFFSSSFHLKNIEACFSDLRGLPLTTLFVHSIKIEAANASMSFDMPL